MARVAANIRTNIQAKDCPESFLENTSNYLSEQFKTSVKNITLEIHTDIQMMRNGTKDSMMNIDIHHNSDSMDVNARRKLAGDIAKFVNDQLDIPKERTLVLFFDTKKCT